MIQDLRDAGVREVTLVLEDGQARRRQIGFVEAEGDFLDEDEPSGPTASRRPRG